MAISNVASSPASDRRLRERARCSRPSRRALSASNRQRLRADVGAEPVRLGKLGEQGEQEAARAGADIDDGDRLPLPALERGNLLRGVDQGLALGSRVEGCRRNPEGPAVEVARAGNARQRLVCEAAGEHAPNAFDLAGIERSFLRETDACPLRAERHLEDTARFARQAPQSPLG